MVAASKNLSIQGQEDRNHKILVNCLPPGKDRANTPRPAGRWKPFAPTSQFWPTILHPTPAKPSPQKAMGKISCSKTDYYILSKVARAETSEKVELKLITNSFDITFLSYKP